MVFPKKSNTDYELSIVKDGTEYRLPVGWALTDAGNFTFRNKLQSRAFAHGSDMVGDGKIDGRTIQLEFLMEGITEEEHDEVLNQAYTFFSQTEYNLMTGRPDRVYHVAGLSKIKHKYQKGFKQRMSNITVSLLLSDPFRYEAQESKVVYEFLQPAVQAEMVLHNLGSVDTPLTFRFIPSNNMSKITVWHQEAKEKFVMNDALLIKPKETVVSSKDGTVWRGNDNSINTFSGAFLYARPGNNLFLYTGGAGRLEITYTNRWYV